MPDPGMGEDPYRAPETELVDAPLVEVVESASKSRRFFNWLIDRLAVVGLLFLFFLVAYAVGGEEVAAWIDNIDTVTDYAISYATMLVYYTLMEGLVGFTIGKLVTGTRAVDGQGRRLGFGRALLRSLCRLIPFDAISLLISDDDVRRAWHDSITRTYVVRRKSAARASPAAAHGLLSDSTTISSS